MTYELQKAVPASDSVCVFLLCLSRKTNLQKSSRMIKRTWLPRRHKEFEGSMDPYNFYTEFSTP